ncbi:hypothetical protein C8R41DRAFT_970774 [Lentinula lateritia]|uniref:RNA-directed RNA polymerase n=1 Tax=Lentinula lateritia TaxID=40482 RepID=A0ABQ8V2P2_9AGAR|nr:hypothetical protein C8R41DRAFT_970774 [Lentinula lateritia]
MDGLYSALPTKAYSLRNFVRAGSALDSPDIDGDAYLLFLLTGQHVLEEHQAVIDARRNTLNDDHSVGASRDYDSLIGIADNILVNAAISVYPAPNPAEVLSSSIHLKIRLPSGDVSTNAFIPIHRIPNFQFAVWGNRCQIHIFFPGIASRGPEDLARQLSKEEKTTFYEIGLRPAIAALLPEDISDWPPTYDGELFRARKQSGHMSYQTKIIPELEVPNLVGRIRRNLEDANVDWAESFFFTHTVRGFKHGTQHEMNEDEAQLALDILLNHADLSRDATERGEWWIDVGLELCSDIQSCLQWVTTSHYHMVKEVLKISEANASRITSLGSSKYQKDIVSHIMDVAGCRIEPGSRAQGEYEAVYFQLYTTDKAITYNPEGRHHGKAISTNLAMGPTQPPTFISGLFELFTDAMTRNSSNARIEVRVPIRHATRVLVTIDVDLVRRNLLAFPRSTWWKFRAQRVEAISRVLMRQQEGDPQLRIKPAALQLTAACVWLLNGLHSRPDDGSSARNLMTTVLPLTDSLDPDPNTVLFLSQEEEFAELPYNPFGVIFLRCISLKVPVPRMRHNPEVFLLPNSFQYLFNATQDEIRHKYHSIGVVPRHVEAQRRIVTNKTRRTKRFIPVDEILPGSQFNLESRGYALPPPPADDGSDKECENEEEGNLDAKLTSIWFQFLLDMADRSPAPKRSSSASYLKLTSAQRQHAGEELYMNLKLSDVWTAVRWKLGTPSEFQTAFGNLFPEKDHETQPKVQNYTQCRYYMEWKTICASGDAKTITAARQELWRKVLRLQWIPQAASDKMWNTQQPKRQDASVRFPPDSEGPAPRILCRRKPTW